MFIVDFHLKISYFYYYQVYLYLNWIQIYNFCGTHEFQESMVLEPWSAFQKQGEYSRKFVTFLHHRNWTTHPATSAFSGKDESGIQSWDSPFMEKRSTSSMTSPYLVCPCSMPRDVARRRRIPQWRDCSAKLCGNGRLLTRLFPKSSHERAPRGDI